MKTKIIAICSAAAILLLPLFLVLIILGATLSAASEAVVPEYNKAAGYIGASWQALLAFDTVRYENELDEVNPYDTAMEFAIIYYKKYRYIRPKCNKGAGHWVLVSSGTLDTPKKIRKFFHLEEKSDLLDVIKAMEAYEQPKPYEFILSSKTIDEVMEEHNLTEEKKEHIGLLITEGLLDEQFGSSIPGYFDVKGTGYFAWPLPGIPVSQVTSSFGTRYHPVDKVYRTHYGTDIGCPEGSAVIAPADGMVQSAGFAPEPGNYVYITIKKDDMVFTVQLMHLASIKVSNGQTVTAGQTVATSGNTGKSTGPHLHIGILCNGSYIDPLPLIKPAEEKDVEK